MATKLYSLFTVFATSLPSLALAQTPAATAKVVMYRPFKLFGWGVNYGIYHEGQGVCGLSNRRYLVMTVPTGSVVLRSHIMGLGFVKEERLIRFQAQAGETYFIQTNPRYWSGALDMAIVPAEYAKGRLQRIPKPDHCSEPFSFNQ
ncbi:hypothetical protein J0X19_05850 [Hymenobacter sp. BT186]|uniref:DUF2846 domain-containing protein n=1 Tax=Hymenobacter telluris TaxID=2816474 RepID=A0A939JBM8_9BACT|nr:hypothetical protein [Hymenobacter telluris]MBO0357460.1 hypothetical protein [Hymenobacter telluris]MBW3373486.1 hypothetical protein [Hymenobacter norwichensis]